MTLTRLVPVLLLKHGLIVRSERFKVHQAIGSPLSTVERYSQWNLDELVILDISSYDFHDLRRDDMRNRYVGSSTSDLLRQISRLCTMPLTFGGRVRTLDDIAERLDAGADKVAINSQAVQEPKFIEAAARRFGSQCVVVVMDVGLDPAGRQSVFVDGGRRQTSLNPVDWAREAAQLGAGELIVQSMDRDGMAGGYDLDLIGAVSKAVSIPVVALGGASQVEHFRAGVADAGADAVAAANIFHFSELSYPRLKAACIAAGLTMRPPKLGSRWFGRTPTYDAARRDTMIADRLRNAESGNFRAARPRDPSTSASVRWCTRCVYPAISAAPMEFDQDGVCTGCRAAEEKRSISAAEWSRRWDAFKELVQEYRCRDGSRHDCIIPVSGGKDSYFQAHVIKNELGLNPLLVTYDANNWTEVGWRNLRRMSEVFGVDHVLITPSTQVLKKLNRQAFIIMGDMNWHAHVGIDTAPVRVAADRRIPLLIWGEHGYLDLSGQFSMTDYPEMTYRFRLEHCGRGFEWNYFVGLEGLTEQDLSLWRYPSDNELMEVGVRGAYLGNYVYWEANDHFKLIHKRYGFEESPVAFDRTYRRMSNLDDMHENGAHDYLKYVKFGYGRCTDHACKDIRAGILSRKDAVALVRRYDHVKPSDLQRWLAYVGMSEEQFDRIADTFRDPRVWRMTNGEWVRDELPG